MGKCSLSIFLVTSPLYLLHHCPSLSCSLSETYLSLELLVWLCGLPFGILFEILCFISFSIATESGSSVGIRAGKQESVARVWDIWIKPRIRLSQKARMCIVRHWKMSLSSSQTARRNSKLPITADGSYSCYRYIK